MEDTMTPLTTETGVLQVELKACQRKTDDLEKEPI